ncbi:uncharacterized protein LOC18424270 isoform X1 [Amborella trichopoda]|uniref:uncharacterized protein LOC18424270 isoform X1 n=1 Tax=Amborella trichopoda TaxID=13333 RepID=UPI0009BF1697|nr:uncharacterized protein LOC18424270 isoform X1 [Amborella trichopoda]|eukprot:XP_020517124.1 uncharacterized protein LOC18424270 isoform X1 [Amborella trichopoda]
MRKHCIRETVKESTTTFATTFLTIQSILDNKAGLRSMIRSNEWQTDRAATSQHGKQPTLMINPQWGFWFDAMRHARKFIFQNNIWTEEILKIVDSRWRDQLHRDIHAARFILNPQNLYSNATLDDADIMEGVRNCIYKLEPDLEDGVYAAYHVHGKKWGICIEYAKKVAGKFTQHNGG